MPTAAIDLSTIGELHPFVPSPVCSHGKEEVGGNGMEAALCLQMVVNEQPSIGEAVETRPTPQTQLLCLLLHQEACLSFWVRRRHIQQGLLGALSQQGSLSPVISLLIDRA